MMGDGTKLGDIFLFDGAPEAAAMAEGCPIVSYSRGEIIYDPSACRRALGVVLSGRAEAVSALQEKTVLPASDRATCSVRRLCSVWTTPM